jgi:NSS family neurotransmitter:Na+ symporter
MANSSNGREEWRSRLGFIMAAIGSAVGLGNIWRFPYMTAESGGAGFLILYLVLLFLIGIPVMISEFIIGRNSRLSPVKALSSSSNSDWKPLGILFVITGFIIVSLQAGLFSTWSTRWVV